MDCVNIALSNVLNYNLKDIRSLIIFQRLNEFILNKNELPKSYFSITLGI